MTEEVGLAGPWWYTHGCAVADYDRDGWPDLLVTGYGRLALFHNEPDGKGGRHFVEVTSRAGLADNLWSTSAAWGDLDGDGYPELYVCHYWTGRSPTTRTAPRSARPGGATCVRRPLQGSAAPPVPEQPRRHVPRREP